MKRLLITAGRFIDKAYPGYPRSKAWVCDGSLAGIAGSNPFWVFYVLLSRGLCDGCGVVCLNLVALAHYGCRAMKKKYICI
jgi:hypothetical protein